jgi:hypothetical protein
MKVRSLAVISLKNGVGKYWRKTSKGAIKAEERMIIKQNQLMNLSEPSKQLSVQQAIVTCKIARFDFPKEWPNLLETLIPIVEQSFLTHENHLKFNSLYTLHLIMKTLVSKTLPMAKKIVQDLTPNVFLFLKKVFYEQSNLFFIGIANGQSQQELDLILNLARVTLKTLRRLAIGGYIQFSTAPEVIEFITYLIQHLPKFLEIISTTSDQLYKTLESLILTIGKLYVDMSNSKVVDLVLSPPFLPILSLYWSLLQPEALPAGIFAEKLRIQAMKIFKNTTQNREFQIVSERDRDSRIEQALVILDTKLFTPEFVVSAGKLLLSKYLFLSREDLDLWEDDPESFVQEEESDHWEYHQRGMAEKLFMVLVSKNRAVLCPLIISALGSLNNEMTSESILMKEAVYSAVGLCSHDLYDYLDFDEWSLTLLTESQNPSPDFKVVLRRISNILGNWTSVKSTKEKRATIYQNMILLLTQSDLVVKLTAVCDLKKIVDDFDFMIEIFTPFLQIIVDLFMDLLQKVDEFDSRMNIINCLVVIIERMDGQVLPSVVPLVRILPELWKRSENQNLFRISIVTILSKLVKTLRSESYQVHEMVIPILKEALDTTKPGHVYLLEEGLGLWLVTIQNCQSSLQLLELFPVGLRLLEYGNETLKTVLHILESYVLIDPLSVLQNNAVPLVEGITKLVGGLTVNASNALLRFVDILVQSCENSNCFQDLFHVMFTQGLFSKVMNNVLVGEDLGPIVVGFLMLLARMAIYSPVLLLEAIEGGGMQTLDEFLKAMFRRFDSMGHLKQRKLCALALTALMGTGNQTVVSHMGEILSIFTSVGIEVQDSDKQEY